MVSLKVFFPDLGSSAEVDSLSWGLGFLLDLHSVSLGASIPLPSDLF